VNTLDVVVDSNPSSLHAHKRRNAATTGLNVYHIDKNNQLKTQKQAHRQGDRKNISG
jgi:hypothetical protein